MLGVEAVYDCLVLGRDIAIDGQKLLIGRSVLNLIVIERKRNCCHSRFSITRERSQFMWVTCATICIPLFDTCFFGRHPLSYGIALGRIGIRIIRQHLKRGHVQLERYFLRQRSEFRIGRDAFRASLGRIVRGHRRIANQKRSES